MWYNNITDMGTIVADMQILTTHFNFRIICKKQEMGEKYLYQKIEIYQSGREKSWKDM